MAILWQSSLVPFTDPVGNPYVGAEVYFFDANTTTPKVVYTDASLDVPHDHPVVANGSGMFPPIFIDGGAYRVRILTQQGTTLWDVNGISVPASADDTGGGGGDTPVTLPARTGDLKDRYDTGPHSGWVRANGRTIGAAASGATERANADTEALFALLWAVDTTLVVSGGRGDNPASDFAANKTIELPNFKQRARIGLATMGGTAATLIPDAVFDDEDGDVLGATVGAGEITLTTPQMPAHNHTGTANSAGSHTHSFSFRSGGTGGTFDVDGNNRSGSNTKTTNSAGAHTHTLTINNAGGGQAHPNVQPSKAVTVYIKL